MKILSIERDENDKEVFYLTFQPSFWSEIFGAKDNVVKYKSTGQYYTNTLVRQYINELGIRTRNDDLVAIAIDGMRVMDGEDPLVKQDI